MVDMFELDDINRDMLDILQLDGRISYRELGQRVGLSATVGDPGAVGG